MTPRAPSPPAPMAHAMSTESDYMAHEMSTMAPTSSNREAVGWFADLAANQTTPQHEHLPSMAEESEEEHASVPQIHVDSAQENDPMQDIDQSVEFQVRSLYQYEGQRAEDLSFSESLLLTAHPSKSGGDWWYGTTVRDGKKGFFPKTYVEQVTTVKAKALYSYDGTNSEELSFSEGDNLAIVDHGDSDWWKAERGGVVFIVPAAYLEIVDGACDLPTIFDPVAVAASIRKRITPEPVWAWATPTNQVSHGVADSADDDADDDTDDEDESDWDSDEDSDFFTATESESSGEDEEQTEEQRRAEREARALERQRVLEAAGLIVTKTDRKPPPRPARKKSVRKRRPAPAVPMDRPRTGTGEDPALDLHAEPDHELDARENSLRLDDAYERYEAFKNSSPNMNRLSMASVDTTISFGSSAPSPSPSVTILGSPLAEADGRSHSSHFLHFFGRNKTPANDGEAPSRPVISGPIPIGDKELATSAAADSGFGSSWASLIDKSVLEEIPTQERKRQEAIFELITTEAAYVRDLQLIVEVFYSALLPILDEKAITVIFANVEDILLTNTTFLSSLENRQKECRLYIDKIGDLLKNNMSNMGIYLEYCINQANAIKVLQSLRQSNPDLASCLQRLRDGPAVRNLDLSSYLLVPSNAKNHPLPSADQTSRDRASAHLETCVLTNFQILHYSEVAEEREQIEAALEVSEKVLRHINESIRDQEGKERLRVISRNLWIGEGRLDLTAPTRNMGTRKLLKEGPLSKCKSGRRLRAFLCSDILVLTDEHAKTLYRMPIPLSEIQIQEVPGWRDDLAFQIALAYPRGGDKINLKATSARDCQVWMQSLERASRKCREAEKSASQRR
ncbi:hypothetical protein NM688_g6740 [Phlebia brevispora]|uniref:Uncharacterized protein n=1 Tax=Phlebia brevispora TaxID=194682 RepID=A0ACC1SCX2_9APHY|nr:hypothetical protein NM688_g6740 [Phlebia brevispora]